MATIKVIIILGSGSDEEFSNPIAKTLENLGIPFERRVASAHRTPSKLLEILRENENLEQVVYITVAGLSNALSGIVDANTVHPVIACPPPSDRFAGVDIFSSLRMPRGVAPLVVLEPENAALAAAKILSGIDSELRVRVEHYQRILRERVEKDDARLKS